MAALRELDDICVEDVVVLDGRRGLNEKTVTALVQSMTAIGLKTPITVRLVDMIVDGHDTHNAPVLVTGRHRLEAARRLGWHKIDSWIVPDEDEIDAEIWEIDENLMRAELSPAEEAQCLARRKELWELREAESGRTSPTLGGRGHSGFAQDTADKTGTPKRTLNQKVERGNKVVVLDEVKGTSLDKGTELDALAKLSEEEQRELAQKARAGEQVTARKAKPTVEYKDADDEQLDGLKRAWNRASAKAREQFQEWVATNEGAVFDASRGGAAAIPERFRRDANNRAAWMEGAD